MRNVPSGLTTIWGSGNYAGSQRPMARVTVQRHHIPTFNYQKQVYGYANFGQTGKPRELPNVKSVEWDRSIDNDSATCTIELYNVLPIPAGKDPYDDAGNLDAMGWFSPARGTTTFTTRWGHLTNKWKNYIVPNRIIRTYEGYGFDRTVAPEADSHLVQTGVWIIDDVELTADATIKLTCRDLAGKLLIEQIMFPPVVPLHHYPLKFDVEKTHTRTVTSSSTSGSWIHPRYSTDSGVPYVGLGGTVLGHHGSDAFDTSNNTYWLSIGNDQPNADYAFEYVEGSIDSQEVNGFKFKVWGGPYRVYLSVYGAKTPGGTRKWQGEHTVPYNSSSPAAAPNGADERFVHSMLVDHEDQVEVKLNRSWFKVTKVRLTFHGLYNSGQGQFPYRAGVRDFKVSHIATESWSVDQVYTTGNYNDYTDVVKLLLAYAGFWWPKQSALAKQVWSDGTIHTVHAPSNDDYLGRGRIWGDMAQSGTNGPAELTVDIFDKKPVMDGITYIKNILGFLFYVDETGAAVWRPPNIWATGNYVGDASAGPTRTSAMVTIDENVTLMAMTQKMSSRDMREHIFVANTSGKVGAMVKGYKFGEIMPSAGLRRVAGWTDQHFSTTKECTVMADLIALRSRFTYRTYKLTIPGYPRIQIDDQVRVLEGTTAEDNIHYVRGIHSSLDMQAGEWTYELDTHFLGEEPFSKWVFDPADLDPQTQAYLRDTLGVI